MNDEKFIKRVETLIDPMAVSSLLTFQRLRKLLPRAIMKRLLHRAARKVPRIGFVIDPYSLFLFFRLKDIEQAKSMLPERYELAKTSIFADEEPDYYMGIGNLSTRASTFWGVRQESYLIARDKVTGLLSWIFIDILSNTVIALPTEGIASPNTETAVFTTNAKGEVFLDIREAGTARGFAMKGSIRNAERRALDEPIWLMGNTSIGHSKRFADGEDRPFAVIFDPAEVHEALEVPLEDIEIRQNTLFPGLAETEPCKALCFPFAQHYIADSPGCFTSVTDRDDMIRHYTREAESDDLKTFSGRTILVQIGISFAVCAAVIILLLIAF
jgi:hypothetical protein